MDKRLRFTPSKYKEKLISYSRDTVDFEALNGLIKYKINKHDNPAVVEAGDGYFRIYISTRPKVTFWRFYPNSVDIRTTYNAHVYILDQDVVIKVFWNKFYKIAFIIWFLFVGGSTLFVAKVDGFDAMFFLLFLIALSVYILLSKRRFKIFIINFLNGLMS